MANPFSAIWRDLKFGFRLMRVLSLMSDLKPDDSRTLVDDFEEVIDTNPEKVAFIFEGREITYREFDECANQIAAWGSSQGLSAGDVVALNLENSPEFVFVWYGLMKIGVATALINTNLEGKGLYHCISIVDAKLIIAGGEQADRCKLCASDSIAQLPLWDFDGVNGHDLAPALAKETTQRPSPKLRGQILAKDTALFIYTSGTTGLPKAAKISHLKLRSVARTAKVLVKIGSKDRVYNALPLYHITGGGLGLVGTLTAGATMILRRKFSVSEFWDDVVDYKATLFVYIGELCRYLEKAPDHPKQNKHQLRAGYGNGLRGEVWRSFIRRFKVPTMRELYGSTEGNVVFLNLDGTIGSIGQMPPWIGTKIGMEIVKFDVVDEQPVRGMDGFCIRVDVDEAGEVIGKISDEVGRQNFTGYHDKKATEAKILRNVFTKDDRWFRTGDLVRRDANNYIYFVDRIGDTFRWKGENVATNEVSDAMSNYKGIELANVYGIKIHGADGRAGMAAITVQNDFSIAGLADYLSDRLPAYAIPLFIRIQEKAETTGTFKFRKVELVKQAYDLSKIDDPIWFFEPGAGGYVEFDYTKQAMLEDGHYKL